MLLLLLLLFIVVVLLFAFLVLYINTPKRLDIPGPPQLPIVGNFFEAVQRQDDILGLLADWTKKYGDVLHFANFSRNIILTNDPACIQHILQNNFKNYIRYPENPTAERFFGEGIFLSNGDAWKFHRETARPMFKSASIEKMGEVFEDRAQVVLEILSKVPRGETVEVQDLFMRYTLDSIGQVGFGYDIGSLQNPEKCEFAKHFDSAQRIIETTGNNPLIKYLPHATFNENMRHLDDYVFRIIEQRRREGDYESRTDLLSRYMSLKDEHGKPLSNEYLRDTVLNFFIAGRDTTGILLTWTFYLLAQHPEEKEKLLGEIRKTFGPGPNIKIDSRALKGMKYLHNVLRETLRLYPPVPVEGRTALGDDVLPTGHVVTGRTLVLFCPVTLHRTEKYWGSDAEQFRPSRWEGIGEGAGAEGGVGEGGRLQHAFQYVPFHAGPQTCLGQNMALREAKILVCLVLSRFDFTLDESHVVKPRKSIVMPADKGVKLFFQERATA